MVHPPSWEQLYHKDYADTFTRPSPLLRQLESIIGFLVPGLIILCRFYAEIPGFAFRRAGTRTRTQNSLTSSGEYQRLGSAMATDEKFANLIGRILVNCGILEYLTIVSIEKLETDSKRADEILGKLFKGRIKELRQLLHVRTKLPTEQIDSLCDQLSRVAGDRNDIAHNPIISDDVNGANPRIAVVRRMSDLFNGKVVTDKNLESLLERSRKTLDTFKRLMLDAGVYGPENFPEQGKF